MHVGAPVVARLQSHVGSFALSVSSPVLYIDILTRDGHFKSFPC